MISCDMKNQREWLARWAREIINQNHENEQRRNPLGRGVVRFFIEDQGCCGAPVTLKKGSPFTSPEERGRSPTAPLIGMDS